MTPLAITSHTATTALGHGLAARAAALRQERKCARHYAERLEHYARSAPCNDRVQLLRLPGA